MMRTSLCRDQTSGALGFTLVELAVVLVFFGLVATISVPALNAVLDRQREKDDFQRVEVLITKARTISLQTKETVSLTALDFDVENLVLSRSTIRFFPDGTVTPVTVSLNGMSANIDWLTGRMEVGR